MYRSVCLWVILTLPLLAAGASQATSKVILKKDLFRGYRWSADSGNTYQQVGNGGSSLRQYLADNEAATEAMYRYRTRKYIARGCGYAGAATLGYLIYQTATDDFTKEEHPVLLATLALGVLTMILDIWADNNLKDAVEWYNAGVSTTRARTNNLSDHTTVFSVTVKTRIW